MAHEHRQISMAESNVQPNAALKLISDIDGEPVIFDDNPAHIEGVLRQCALYFERTGLYAALCVRARWQSSLERQVGC